MSDNVLLPAIDSDETDVIMPSKTWLIVNNRLLPTSDNIAAVVQSAYSILQTPRYKHLIYSWQYGSELDTLVGKDEAFVLSESRRMIRDALSTDDRILDVSNFYYSDKILYFTLETIYGNSQLQTEVISDENI